MRARQQSSTTYPMLFLMVLSVDHVTPATGKTVTVTLSKNGGNFGAAAGSVTEVANGWYSLAGNATDRNTLGPLALHATATGCDNSDPIPWDILTVDPFAADLGLSNVSANVAQWNGSNVATPNVTGVPIVDLKYILGTALSETVAGNLAAAFKKFFDVASSVFTTASINQTGDSYSRLGAPAGASVSADIAEIEAETDGIASIPTNPLLTTDARLNNLDATISSRLPTTDLVSDSGTAQSGSTTNIRLRSGAPAVNLTGQTVFIQSGTGSGQSSAISAYNTSTKDATTTWTTAPANDSVYVVLTPQGGSSGGGTDPLTNTPAHYSAGQIGAYLDADLAAIKAKTDTIGSASLSFNAPSINGGTEPLIIGRSYKQIYGNAITFTVANLSVDLTAPGITTSFRVLVGTSQPFAGVATSATGGYIEVAASATASWMPGAYETEFVVLDGADPIHIVSGTINVSAGVG